MHLHLRMTVLLTVYFNCAIESRYTNVFVYQCLRPNEVGVSGVGQLYQCIHSCNRYRLETVNEGTLWEIACHMRTRSQAVARIADRTASQQTSNYSVCVNRPSILWVYQLNLEETKTNNCASIVQYKLKIREGSRQVRAELPVWCFVISLRPWNSTARPFRIFALCILHNSR